MIEYRDLDDHDASVFVQIASNSIRSAHKYAFRTAPDGYVLHKVYPL